MKSFVRWIITTIFSLTFAFSALARGNGALPGLQSPFAGPMIRHVERTVLHDNIAHYRYDVRVGPGEFDAIRLHRIVKERRPYHPVATLDGVLLLPGAPNSVEMIFMEPLISEVPAWDHSVTAFLAKNDMDVWAMDYRWALVPATQQDFTFMKDWDLERDIRDTEIALTLARTIRWMTGQGGGQLDLLGFSWGVQVAYGVAGDETQKPFGHRSVKGLITVDSFLKTDNEAQRVATCAGVEYEQGLLDSGVYRNDGGVFLKSVGDLAKSDPSGESPLAPPFTNFQFALLAGSGFVGAYYDESGVPTGLRYTDPGLWVDALRAVPPYVPTQALWDFNAALCGEADVKFDDHLNSVAVPILYVGSAGGAGLLGYYTTTLTASKDITKFTLQFFPADQQALDFGHADLFMARDAETLVWRPILDWIIAHR